MKVFMALCSLASLSFSQTSLESVVRESSQLSQLPPRPATALGGRLFLDSISKLGSQKRELAMVKEILSGNVPQFLRTLQPVTYRYRDSKGRNYRLTTFVMPDYLAIGSDTDFVRVPLNLLSANTIAQKLNATLPTRKMSNSIYQQASLKLEPSPIQASPQMTSVSCYIQHNEAIKEQLDRFSIESRRLVAGHKKDVIYSRLLETETGAIAIFGWHKLSSHRAIQPLSTVHSAYYADYSHGIRLVNRQAILEVDQFEFQVDIHNILRQDQLSQLVSDEGGYSLNHQVAKIYSLGSQQQL